jgi:hypothetical protein
MIRIQAIYSRRFRKFGFERPATIPLLGPEPLRDAHRQAVLNAAGRETGDAALFLAIQQMRACSIAPIR